MQKNGNPSFLVKFIHDLLYSVDSEAEAAMWLEGPVFNPGTMTLLTTNALYRRQAGFCSCESITAIRGTRFFNLFPDEPDCLYLPWVIPEETDYARLTIALNNRSVFGLQEEVSCNIDLT